MEKFEKFEKFAYQKKALFPVFLYDNLEAVMPSDSDEEIEATGSKAEDVPSNDF